MGAVYQLKWVFGSHKNNVCIYEQSCLPSVCHCGIWKHTINPLLIKQEALQRYFKTKVCWTAGVFSFVGLSTEGGGSESSSILLKECL